MNSSPTLLQSLYKNGKVSYEEVIEQSELMKKEYAISKVCDLNKIKRRKNDNRHYIYIDRKQYTANTYKEMIDFLYDYFFGITTYTLEDLFPKYMIYRRDSLHTCDKTLKENQFLWNSLFKDRDITKIPLPKLTVQDFHSFFCTLTKDRTLTRKRFNDGKSILNGIYSYAILEGIVSHNPLKELNYRIYTYKPENKTVDIYTLEERELLLNYLKTIDKNIYALAIRFDFHIIARIGELKALKWTDIDWNRQVIRIQSQILEQQSMNDDLSFQPTEKRLVPYVKGKTSSGFRDIPLTPEAIRILEEVKELNPSGRFIFMTEDGTTLTTVTFNRFLEKSCEAVGIPYRSSHKIRFTVASMLYNEKAVCETQLQEWLGHSTLAMTLHYLRPVTSNNDARQKMVEILG